MGDGLLRFASFQKSQEHSEGALKAPSVVVVIIIKVSLQPSSQEWAVPRAEEPAEEEPHGACGGQQLPLVARLWPAPATWPANGLTKQAVG